MAMPAIAPIEREGLGDDAATAGVAVAIGVVGLVDEEVDEEVEELEVDVAEVVDATSEGKPSPGLNINVAFLTKAIWLSSVCVEF
jgi:hypothetical protein